MTRSSEEDSWLEGKGRGRKRKEVRKDVRNKLEAWLNQDECGGRMGGLNRLQAAKRVVVRRKKE